MPPPLCLHCRRPAALRRPRTGEALCRPCFVAAFEAEAHRALLADDPPPRPGETLAVASSGGKDSAVLAHLLARLEERHGYGLRLVLLSVDEGIAGYRDASLGAVRRGRGALPLLVVSFEELFGWSMDRVARRLAGGASHCTFCGVLRRQALERGARLLGVDRIATGHNADDIAETVLMNVLRGDVARLRRAATEATTGATRTTGTTGTTTGTTGTSTGATGATNNPLEATTASASSGSHVEATRSHVEATKKSLEATKSPTKVPTASKTTKNSTETTKNPMETTKNPMETTTKSSEATKSHVEATKNLMEATRSHVEATKSSPKIPTASKTNTSSTETTKNPMEATKNSMETTTKSSEATKNLMEATKSHVEATRSSTKIPTASTTTKNSTETTKNPMETTTKSSETTKNPTVATTNPTVATTKPLEATTSPTEPPPPSSTKKPLKKPPKPPKKPTKKPTPHPQVPRPLVGGPWPAVARCKPLRHAYEKEIVLYAYFQGLDYVSTECVYAPHAYRGHARALLKDLEAIRASTVAALGHSGRRLAVATEVATKTLGACGRCGYAASQPLCKACVLLASLERGLPRLGLGKRSLGWPTG